FKKDQRDTGEISPCTFLDYARTVKKMLKLLGRNRLVADLRPDDWEKVKAAMAKTMGLVSLGNTINKMRIVCNYAWDNDLIAKKLNHGQGFKRPKRKAIRKVRQAQGERMFEAHEINAMLAAAKQPLKAMILLGVNCGFGNSDCGNLPLK